MYQKEISNPIAYKVGTRVLFFVLSALFAYLTIKSFYSKFEPQDFNFDNLLYWEAVGVKFHLYFVYIFVYLFVQSAFSLFKSGYMSASLFVGFAVACMINLISCFFFGVKFGVFVAVALLLGELAAYIWYFKSAETVLMD